jgi:hypothetical protein
VDCGVEAPGGLRISVDAIAFLLRMTNTSLRKMASEGITPGVLREVKEINMRVRRSFLQRELRSYRVMQETLARVEGA